MSNSNHEVMSASSVGCALIYRNDHRLQPYIRRSIAIVFNQLNWLPEGSFDAT